METRVIKLKGDFNNIISIRTNVKNVFDILKIRIDKLHEIYSEFIKNNKNEMFVFGLDSFNFQSKLIDIEYEDMKRLFLAINNRMYCEYFKLHKIIIDYISKNIHDKKAVDFIKIKKFPIYKDLEPYKEYNFELILDLHENILNLLSIIISLLKNKENELLMHKGKQNIGLNIDNFITTFNFNINVMKEKIVMFITYIEFFHKMHTKYLKRFSNKIQLIYSHINNDIKFDDTVEVSKHKKKELIDDLISNDIDKELLKDIKTSIGSETNSENSGDESTDKVSNDTTTNAGKPLINVFKKNVHKLTSVLKANRDKERNISNADLDTIFSGINKSCDNIIDKSENIGINIETFENNSPFSISSIHFNTEDNIIDKTDTDIVMDDNTNNVDTTDTDINTNNVDTTVATNDANANIINTTDTINDTNTTANTNIIDTTVAINDAIDFKKVSKKKKKNKKK